MPQTPVSPCRRSTPHSRGQSVRDALYRQHREWRSVRYRWGGLSKEGVDCSGFVHLTYENLFGIALPRSTKAQSRAGRKISRRHLRAGDLVFFKTGIFSRHVGIYLEKNTFLHASRKEGVTLSNLENRYWHRRYWQSRRVQGS